MSFFFVNRTSGQQFSVGPKNSDFLDGRLPLPDFGHTEKSVRGSLTSTIVLARLLIFNLGPANLTKSENACTIRVDINNMRLSKHS